MDDPIRLLVPQVLNRVRRLRSRQVRQSTGLHFVEGFRQFLQSADCLIPVDLVLYSEILAQNPAVQKTVRRLKREGTRVVRVSPQEFRSISETPHASGIGAILRQHWTPLDRLDPRRGLCWIALRWLRSPGNLGTLFRTAEAVGAAGAILIGDAADPFDPATVRASMGGVFHLELARASLGEFGGWCRRHGCTVLGTSPSAEAIYTRVPVGSPLVVMFGEERAGLTPAEEAVCTHRAKIPMVGAADSLNIGVAAGVMLYEVFRRRVLDSSNF
jgi:TrmH family RNA methyltransferase